MTTLGQDRSKYALEQVLQVGQRIDNLIPLLLVLLL